MIAVTAVYGGYDTLKPHPDHPEVTEWRCYTDDPDLTSDDWTVVHAPLPYNHPRMNAKWWKCHPPASPDDLVLWIDGSVVLHNPAYIDEVLTRLERSPMAMFRHPDRDGIFDEADVSQMMTKYIGHDVQGQVDYYRRQYGTGAHGGLWATTTFGWHRSRDALALGAAWFAHCELLTYQDQLSLPPLLERYGIRPEPIDGNLWRNDWFRIAHHASDY